MTCNTLTKYGSGTLDISSAVIPASVELEVEEGTVVISQDQFLDHENANTHLFFIESGATAIYTGSSSFLALFGHYSGTLDLQSANLSSVQDTTDGGIIITSGTVIIGQSLRVPDVDITNGAKLKVAAHTGTNVRVIDDTAELSIDSTSVLDLTNNAMIVRSGDLPTITGLVVSGANGNLWNGTGINSSTAVADTNHITGLGVARAGALSLTGTTFQTDTTVLGANDVLVKYTYLGDANLSGTVDANDYELIDGGFFGGLSGWSNGDFNYSGTIDANDYGLIDGSFYSGGGPL